jgi:putative PIG3 family NAD(P)H quinone oxidoreductase
MLAVAPFDPSQPTTEPRLVELPDPSPADDEVLIEVQATALNRVDLLQIRGRYPVPSGESPIPGLECSGIVVERGAKARRWACGARVMALLGGGGQAERVAVPEGQVMALPPALSFAEGAAIPEAGLTAWSNLEAEARTTPGESVLISGATGGVGTFAVQVAHALGARVFATGRDAERLARLPAGIPLLDDEDLGERVAAETAGRGIDVILDLVGGSRLTDRLSLLAPGGRLVLVGLMGGAAAEVDVGRILRRRLRIIGSLLRPRSRAEKSGLVRGFEGFALPRLADGRLRPLLARRFPFNRLAEAYAALAAGGHVGKIVIELPHAA